VFLCDEILKVLVWYFHKWNQFFDFPTAEQPVLGYLVPCLPWFWRKKIFFLCGKLCSCFNNTLLREDSQKLTIVLFVFAELYDL